jgi:hypothetical protein
MRQKEAMSMRYSYQSLFTSLDDFITNFVNKIAITPEIPALLEEQIEDIKIL